MPFFDPHQLTWPFVIVPAIIIAGTVNLDNRYLGPYFAVVDVIFNDFGTGYKWSDKEILLSVIRRSLYLIVFGMILHCFDYQLLDISSVFLVAGFLLIWPAFARPLPVYASKSDWQVLLVWALYVVSTVAFGTFGATFWSLIEAMTGRSPWEFIRDQLLGSFFLGAVGLATTAFRVPLQNTLWQRRPKPPHSESKDS